MWLIRHIKTKQIENSLLEGTKNRFERRAGEGGQGKEHLKQTASIFILFKIHFSFMSFFKGGT